jgi:phospholipid/cholesterol/gamma-HCH transport system substrate-binding protein
VADYESVQKKRNFIVGVFVILGLIALGWMIVKFGELPTFISKINSFQVYVQFPTAPGVQKDTPVRFTGFQIGRVTHVMKPEIKKDLITGKEYHQTVTVLSIDEQYSDIPSNVEVKLMTRGLGSSYIELRIDPDKLPAPLMNPDDPNSCFLVDGTWLQGSTGMSSEFFPEQSQEQLELLVQDIRTFLGHSNDIIGDDENKGNIKNTLENLSDASAKLSDIIETANKTMENISKTLENADKTLEQFRVTLADYQELASTGTSTIENIDERSEALIVSMVRTSEEIGKASAQLRLAIERVNQGQGTAGMLLNDAKLYENLLESTSQLQTVMEKFNKILMKIEEKGLGSVL